MQATLLFLHKARGRNKQTPAGIDVIYNPQEKMTNIFVSKWKCLFSRYLLVGTPVAGYEG